MLSRLSSDAKRQNFLADATPLRAGLRCRSQPHSLGRICWTKPVLTVCSMALNASRGEKVAGCPPKLRLLERFLARSKSQADQAR